MVRVVSLFPRWMSWAMLLVCVFKLVLASHDEILSYNADDTGYAIFAGRWYWGHDFGLYSYTRQPTYPLFIAVTQALGVPTRLAIELCWFGACLLAARALALSGVRPLAALLGFVLCVLDPLSMFLFNRLLPDTLYATAFLAFIAGIIGVLSIGRGRGGAHMGLRSWAALAAIAGAITANTRPEAVLVWGVLALAGLAILAQRWLGDPAMCGVLPRARTRFLAACVAPALCIVGLEQTIATITQRQTGVRMTYDLAMPGFKALYKALLEIPPEKPNLLLPIPRDVRDKAYAASPSFARFEPFLDGEQAVAEGKRDCEGQTGVKGEYGAWMIWALRAAAFEMKRSTQQRWTNASELDAFYRQCATELHAAMDAGTLPRRWVPISFVPPEWGLLVRALPESLWKCWYRLSNRDFVRPSPDAVDAYAERAFDASASRRGALVGLSRGEENRASLWLSKESIKRLDSIKSSIAKAHRAIFVPGITIVVIASAIVLVGIVKRRSLGINPAHLAMLLLLAGILSRVLFVAIVDANGVQIAASDGSGHPVQVRYLFACSPLLALAFVAALSVLVDAIIGPRASRLSMSAGALTRASDTN